MWSTVLNIFKKASKYAVIAFTGYEIGDTLNDSGNSAQIVKETTIIKEAQNESNTILIISLIVIVAIIFAVFAQLFKCIVNKNKNANTVQASIQMEAQMPAQQQPQAARRQ